ncbi:MAG: response regulator [Bacteroidales bacterium]|nr:response regulator [Bacteroidales bacterium]
MKKPLVLVVDDSFLNRKFISDALSFEDIDVLEAGSGIEALEILETENPSVIFLDIMMPVMDGMQFIEEMRKRGKAIPVIVVTADSSLHTRQKLFELGIDKILYKPVRYDEIINIARNLEQQCSKS